MLVHAMSSKPERIARAQFESMWDGRLVLITHPRTWADVARSLIPPFVGLAGAIGGFPGRVVRLVQRAAQGLRSAARHIGGLIHPSPRLGDSKAPVAAQVTKRRGTRFRDGRRYGACRAGDDATHSRHWRRHRANSAPFGQRDHWRRRDVARRKAARPQGPRRQHDLGPGVSVTPLPGIAALHDGGFLILGKVGEDKVLVQYPTCPAPGGALARTV